LQAFHIQHLVSQQNFNFSRIFVTQVAPPDYTTYANPNPQSSVVYRATVPLPVPQLIKNRFTNRQGTPTRKVASGREFIILLTCLMASAALSIDLMLPAFPEMRQEFGMSPDSTQVSWIVTSYFLGLAVGPWLYGPASDRYGRRAPLFAGLTLFIVGALLASVAPSWGWVIAARFIWGLGTAAPRALSTAMIRDRYEGSAMAQLMSRMVAVFLLVPILAPSIGAGLINIAPWRIVFWVPAGVALILMIWSRRLPETLALDKRRPFTWSAVGQAGREVLTHRATLSFIVAMTFLFAVMTTYLSGSEVIVEDVYGYGSWFPLIFGTLAVLLAVNSLNNARIVQRMGINKLVRQSALVGVGTSLLLVVISMTSQGRPNFWLFFIALALVVPIAQGLVPNCNTAAMMPVPHIAGTASSIIATVSTAGAALLGNLATSQFDGTVRPLALIIFTFISIGTIAIFIGTKATDASANTAVTSN
jgi:DHA1 family bicyclomycin/chloramphenicol resistance-like MFS transporter